MKSEFTSFDTAAIVHELNETIVGARIEKIYQMNSRTLIFKLHKSNQPAIQMLIESGKRINTTSYVYTKPFTPPAFCRALRKHLRNSRMKQIQQHEFERIVKIEIDTKEGVFLLVTELFGDGNMILVNPKGEILQALTHKRMKDRNIIRGEHFELPPPSGKNPLKLNITDLEKIGNYRHLDIVRALTKFLSIGGLYAEEILNKAGVEKNTPCENLTDGQIKAISIQTKNLMAIIASGEFDPVLVFDEKGEVIDATPFPLRKYINLTFKSRKSFNEAIDEYYSKISTNEKVIDTEKEFTRQLARLQRMLEDQKERIEASNKIIQKNKAIGNIIFAHLGELQFFAQWIMQEKKKDKGWEQIISEIEKENQSNRAPFIFFQSLDSKRRLLDLWIDNTTFSLDLTLSIQENAANHYEKAKKTEKKQKGAEKAFHDTQKRISELKKNFMRKTERMKEEAPQRKKEKAWYEKYHWFNSSDGLLVIGGRDAITNEIMIKKHTAREDIVFHADVVGASFVVIKTEGKIPSEQTMKEAAQFAASYSKAWRELYRTTDVYWVSPSQLSKSSPERQHSKRGSFIVNGKKNYYRKIILSIGIGIMIKEKRIIVVRGPTEFCRRQLTHYVEIVPGREPNNILAERIRRILAEKSTVDWRKQIMSIPVAQIRDLIPSGNGAIAPNI